MKTCLAALAALLLLMPAAEARPRHGCAAGERPLKHGGCATLRPHASVLPAPSRLCPGGGRADALGACPRRVCADTTSPDVNGFCPPPTPHCAGYGCGPTPVNANPAAPVNTPAAPVTPKIGPIGSVPNIAPPPPVFTPRP